MTDPDLPNPMDLLASAQEAMAAQVEAASRTVEGSAGGGVVKVAMTGGGEVTGITIAPQVVDPSDVEMLQDLILAALRDAGAQVVELQRAALGSFGGMDLGSALGDLFGGGGGDDSDSGGDTHGGTGGGTGSGPATG